MHSYTTSSAIVAGEELFLLEKWGSPKLLPICYTLGQGGRRLDWPVASQTLQTFQSPILCKMQFFGTLSLRFSKYFGEERTATDSVCNMGRQLRDCYEIQNYIHTNALYLLDVKFHFQTPFQTWNGQGPTHSYTISPNILACQELFLLEKWDNPQLLLIC